LPNSWPLDSGFSKRLYKTKVACLGTSAFLFFGGRCMHALYVRCSRPAHGLLTACSRPAHRLLTAYSPPAHVYHMFTGLLLVSETFLSIRVNKSPFFVVGRRMDQSRPNTKKKKIGPFRPFRITRKSCIYIKGSHSARPTSPVHRPFIFVAVKSFSLTQLPWYLFLATALIADNHSLAN